MKKNLLKPIVGGVVLGTALFFAGPFIFIVLLLKFIFTPFGMGRMMMHRNFSRYNPEFRYAMTDKIRSMTDEEYASFKSGNSYKSACHHKPFNA